MLDQSHIPSTTDNTQYFFFQGVGSNGFGFPQTWNKPRGASMVYIVCVGGGSGGSGGRNTATTTGGAGGASGCVQTGIYPANTLPDQLYVTVGPGGAGGDVGPGGTTGTVGSASAVFIDSGLTSALIQSSTNGLASLASNFEAVPFVQLGILPAFVASQAGGTAGSNATVSAPAITHANYFVTCGTGGSDFDATGLISGSGGNLTGPYGTFISGGAVNQRGNDGFTNLRPFYSLGGTGGGSGTSVTGGGNGGLGSGGGGSGRGTTNSRGGNGGNGIVIITTI